VSPCSDVTARRLNDVRKCRQQLDALTLCATHVYWTLQSSHFTVLLGSHTYEVRAFCFGRRVCRLSVPRQVSITKQDRRDITGVYTYVRNNRLSWVECFHHVCLVISLVCRITQKVTGRFFFTKFGKQIDCGPGKSWFNFESALLAVMTLLGTGPYEF